MPPPRSRPLEIELSGDVTIQTIGHAHARLTDAFAAGAEVTLSLDGVASADLTLVQLIEAARRSAREAGGSLALATPAADAVLDLLHRGGFLAGAGQREFWLHSGGPI